METGTTILAINRLIDDLLRKVRDRETGDKLREIQRYQRDLEKTISENRQTHTETITSQRAQQAKLADDARAEKIKLKKEIRDLKAQIKPLVAKTQEQKLEIEQLELKVKSLLPKRDVREVRRRVAEQVLRDFRSGAS